MALNPFQSSISKALTPKQLILSLLSGLSDEIITTNKFETAGALFDFEGPAIRSALGRLVKNGTIASPTRGCYAIGERYKPMSSAVRNWDGMLKQIRNWDGGWLLIYTAHLGRSDRVVLRAREQALAFFGFSELVYGLWIRPDNLKTSNRELREHMIALGLDEGTILATAGNVEPELMAKAKTLWDIQSLENGYREALGAISWSTASMPNMTPEEKVRETSLIGNAVIGMLSLDPLLPAQFLDNRLRTSTFLEMLEYREIGRAEWRKFFREGVYRIVK